MVDIVPPGKRSQMMSGIRGKDTKPEIAVRRALFSRGFRYRLHDKRLPGRPDIVFPGRKSVIFIEGCFWHGHGCNLFRLPATRTEFWREKIGQNKLRDSSVRKQLENLGWRHLTIWECAIKGRKKIPFSILIDRASAWLEDGTHSEEIEGATDGTH